MNSIITSKITTDSVFQKARDAQATISTHLVLSRELNQLQQDCYAFEDVMNGISGELQNIDSSMLKMLLIDNETIVSHGTKRGVTIKLDKSVLPKKNNTSNMSSSQEILVTGKKLYPLTTTTTTTGVITVSNITYSGSAVRAGNVNNGFDGAASTTTDTALYDPSAVPSTFTEDYDTVDPIFDALDADANTAIESAPVLAFEQNNTETFLPILPVGMITLAYEAAANANGLQAGLTTFSHNPIASVLDDTRELLLYYTENNYANLNTALSTISSDSALDIEYNALKEAIAGGDGLSGAVAQMDIFKDHTDRLSGLILDEDSPNAEPGNDSTTDEFLNVNDVSGDLQEIFSFDARKFRSAKYMIQASAANTERGHTCTELYILHDNELAYTRELVAIYTQDSFTAYTTQFLENRVRVLANTSAPNTDFVIHGTKLRIARVAESFADMSQQKIITLHESLQDFLDDGIDRVALCSTSLAHPETVGELAREFRDMLAILGGIGAGSTAEKQALILYWKNVILKKRSNIQALIDADYANFVATRKLEDALGIAQSLVIAHTDSSGNTVPHITLNSASIDAIMQSNNEENAEAP